MVPKPAQPIVLYHYWRSSSSWRVRWALVEKGIPFVPSAVDLLAGEQRQPAHLARNPLGMVPVLAIDGLLLAESVAILEYLEETRSTPSLSPADPAGRALMRQLVQIIVSDTQPLQNLSVLQNIDALTGNNESRKTWAERYIARGFDAYEATLAHAAGPGPFSCGSRLSMADLCLVPQCYNARRQGMDIAARWPRIAAIEAACLAQPSGQRSAPEAYRPGSPP